MARYGDGGFSTVSSGYVGTISHVSKHGTEFRLDGIARRFRPMGMLRQIEGTFTQRQVGLKVRVGLNSLGAVIYFEPVNLQSFLDGRAAVRHLERIARAS